MRSFYAELTGGRRRRAIAVLEARRIAGALLVGAERVELRVTPGTYELRFHSPTIVAGHVSSVSLGLGNAVLELGKVGDLGVKPCDIVESRPTIMAFMCEQFAIAITSVGVDVTGRLELVFGNSMLAAPVSEEDHLGDDFVWSIECEQHERLPEAFSTELMCVPARPAVEFYCA